MTQHCNNPNPKLHVNVIIMYFCYLAMTNNIKDEKLTQVTFEVACGYATF